MQGMVAPLMVTASLRLDSLLFRWNAVHVVLAVLSPSLHADRYSAVLCISKERTSSTSFQHFWENRRARSSAWSYWVATVSGMSLL